MVVGREHELGRVDRFLDEIGGGFALLVVEGDAGIGKTTVWKEARRRAEERGMSVLAGRPAAAEAKLSFAAVGDLLAKVGEDAFVALPDPQREALEVALLRRKPTGRELPTRAIAAGFLSLIRGLAAERPVVLAIDDWQWLDLASRRVLEFAARRLEDERVGLLCSVRAPFPGPMIGTAREGRVSRVELGPLSLASLGRIVGSRTGRPLPRPVLVRLAKASGGNPFYALEIARLMEDRAAGAGGALPVPDDLRKLTTSRIRRLPADARESTLLAAVISEPNSDLIDVDALAPAAEAGIVSVDEAGRIEFSHPLFASAAYGLLSSAERRALHRRAAAIVDDSEQQARHLALAADHADVGVAARLDDAAALAASRGASDAAAELAELAAKLTPDADQDRQAERLLAAGRFKFDAGDLARAEELGHEVRERAASDAVRARALQLLAQLHGRLNNYTQGADLAAEGLALAGSDDRLRAVLELELCYCLAGFGDLASGAEHAVAAAAHARAGADEGALACALGCLTMCRFIAGQGIEEAVFEEVLALGDPVDFALVLRPRYFDGVLRLWKGDVDGALERLGRLHDESLERGQEAAMPMVLLYMVQGRLWKGEVGEAVRLAEEAHEASGLLEDPTASAIALGAAALVHGYQGEGELARAEAIEALGLFERLQWRAGAIWPMWALGFLELSEGRPAAVDPVLAPLAQQLSAFGEGDPCLFVFLPDEIEALVALGELDRAEEFLAPFERSSYHHDRRWAIAVAERCRALLAAAQADASGAFAAFERALDAHGQVTMPFERARTLLIGGEIHRRFKQRGRARELLEEALYTFESVGTPLWAARARAELARIGSPSASRDELTETERRLAELAASGLSNQEVAKRAFVSVKTVEANLTRVYRKLGVKSRVGLANALRVSAEQETLQT